MSSHECIKEAIYAIFNYAKFPLYRNDIHNASLHHTGVSIYVSYFIML